MQVSNNPGGYEEYINYVRETFYCILVSIKYKISIILLESISYLYAS